MHKIPSTTLALVGSLIVNAFLVGYIASTFCMRPHMPPMPFDRMETALGHVSPQYQGEVQTLIDAHKKDFMQRMEGMHARFDQIQGLLTAPNFDAVALRKIQKDMAKQDDPKSDILSLLISIGQALPDQERIRFFKESAPDRPPFVGPHPDFHH